MSGRSRCTVRDMLQRMRSWSLKKRVLVLIVLPVASGLARHAVRALSTSIALRLAVDLVLIALLAWVTVTFFRVLLRESEEEAKRNPRPW